MSRSSAPRELSCADASSWAQTAHGRWCVTRSASTAAHRAFPATRFASTSRCQPEIPLPTRVEVNALRGYELYVTPVAPHLIAIAALCEKRVLDAGSGNPEMRLRRLIDASPEVAMRVNGDVERAHRQAEHARLTHPPTW